MATRPTVIKRNGRLLKRSRLSLIPLGTSRTNSVPL